MLSSEQTLPSLPTETHAHILPYCDPQTLGRASLVSLAFLELSSPYLYTHITITGLAQLYRLFYQEHRVSPAPHLDRFLSLNQTRTFTFVEDEYDTYYENHDIRSQMLYPRRSSSPHRTQVDTLAARFNHAPDAEAQPFVTEVWSSFCRLFDPTHVVHIDSPYEMPYPLWIDFRTLDWPSLRSLSLPNIYEWYNFRASPSFRRLTPGSLTIIFDFTGPPDELARLDMAACELAGYPILDDSLFSGRWPPVRDAVVKVRNGEEEEHMMEVMREIWDRPGRFSQQERTRREALSTVVVV